MTPIQLLEAVAQRHAIIKRTEFHYQIKQAKGYTDLWLANHGTALKVLLAGTPQKVKPLVVSDLDELMGMLGAKETSKGSVMDLVDALGEIIKECSFHNADSGVGHISRIARNALEKFKKV